MKCSVLFNEMIITGCPVHSLSLDRDKDKESRESRVEHWELRGNSCIEKYCKPCKMSAIWRPIQNVCASQLALKIIDLSCIWFSITFYWPAWQREWTTSCKSSKSWKSLRGRVRSSKNNHSHLSTLDWLVSCDLSSYRFTRVRHATHFHCTAASAYTSPPLPSNILSFLTSYPSNLKNRKQSSQSRDLSA